MKLLHIQFLRGLAALSVALLHALHDADGLGVRAGLSFEETVRFPLMAGVDVFFVISGFIMVYASRPLFAEPGAPRVFLARRLARIAPLYWAVTTLYLAVMLTAPQVLNNPPPTGWMVVASYLFIPATRHDGLVQPLYSLGWTLNYEMFFYVLFALVIVLRARRAVPVLLAILVGLVAIGRVLWLPQPLAFWTQPIILEFAFGVALAWLQGRGVSIGRPMRWLLSITGLALLLASADYPQLPRVVAWGIPAALLVAAAALRHERQASATTLTHFGVALGDMSYAIYLIHPFVIRGWAELVMRSGLSGIVGPFTFIVLALTTTLLASWIVYLVIERPVTRHVRRRLDRSVAIQPSV